MTELEEITLRLQYLREHPDEVTFDVREGHMGPYSQWTNSYLLSRELWAIGVIERMDILDKKLDTLRENRQKERILI